MEKLASFMKYFAAKFKVFGLRSQKNYKQILLEDNASRELNLDTSWWKQYEQSCLDELVALALKNNTDLAKAADKCK